MHARQILLVLALTVAVPGCGSSGGGSKPATTTHDAAGVVACLDRDQRFTKVAKLAPGGGSLSARDRHAVDAAVTGASDAVVAQSGGPQEHAGVIAEAPVVVDEIYLFADDGAAASARTKLLGSAGGGPHTLLSPARAVGRALVVHYSFGIGDRPGGVPLNADALEPLQRCLAEAGYA
ncbi:MAG: hypothetical protein QOG63_2957 [Thermoleophilaceae bacterium]|nr:hypothetical protein [Thermoleophilaceae bacterium]